VHRTSRRRGCVLRHQGWASRFRGIRPPLQPQRSLVSFFPFYPFFKVNPLFNCDTMNTLQRPSEYYYRQLSPGEFRLIRLLPGEKSSPIRVELIHLPIESIELPFYEAVSYTWGTGEFDQAITCDQKIFKVTESVRDVLSQFRFAHCHRYGFFSCPVGSLWVISISYT
jgi:hypothetical protein